MRRHFFISVCLALWATSSFAKITDSERVHRLTGHLSTLHDDSRTGRHVGGGVLLGLAGLSTAGAIIASTSSDPDMSSNGPLAFGVAGGIFAVTGALVLWIRPDAEKFFDYYQLMGEANAHEKAEKAIRGEMYLEKLARDERRTRYVAGGVAATIGAAQLAVYLASKNKSGNSYLLYEGILFAGISLADFFIESSAETESKAYDHWRERSSQTTQLKWFLAPTTEGMQGGLAMRF